MNAAREFFLKYSLQIVVLVLVVGIMATVSPGFRGEAALFSSLERLIPLGVIAAGLAVTMIAGEFDLSVASMAAFAGAIAIQLGDLGLVASILIATGVGVLLGSLQGWVIARLGISSLVFTVGTLILLRGATWLATGGVPVTLTDYKLSDTLMVRTWVFTPLSLTTIAVLTVLGIFLSRTRWGREISSIGGARQEAVASGVKLRSRLILAFAISGGCGALAGALSSFRGGSATPDGLANMLLLALAAVLIGGVSLTGGRGGMINVAFGIAITAVLAAGMSSIGVKAFVTELFTGVLLLVVILLEFVISKVVGYRASVQRRQPHLVVARELAQPMVH